MDQYVHRLETSYKMELQELPFITQNTREKEIDIIGKRITTMEQRMAQTEKQIQEEERHLRL